MNTSPPLSSISTKSLPSPYSLHSTSPCPTRDLVALTSSVPSTSQQKLTLVRTTGNADTVWDWTPVPPPPTIAPGAPPTLGFGAGRFGMGKGKAKVTPGLEGDIKGLCWDPLGNYIALGLSATSTTSSTSTSSFTLLSVHTGKSPLPPIPLPSSCTSPLSSLSWHALPSPSSSSSTPTSFTHALISRLPPIPKSSTSNAKDTSSAGEGGGSSGITSGPFGGAKNLAMMMMREREKDKDKDAGREIDFEAASGRQFPGLLFEQDGGDEAVGGSGKDSETERDEASVLVIGDESGKAYIYWGGSVYLGSFNLSSNSSDDAHLPRKIIASRPIPNATSSSSSLTLTFLLTAPSSSPLSSPSSSSTCLLQSTSSLNLPPTLQLFSQQATILRSHLLLGCEALNRVKKNWEESRRLGKVWLNRLGELGKNHAHAHPPLSLLLSLLITGRSSTAVNDLLSSKMTSKLLLKWETATMDCLGELKKSLFMTLTPCLERVVVALDEIRAWRDWKEKFGSFRLDEESRSWIDKTILVAKEIIRQSDTLEMLVSEEERCFHSFSFWLKYELEKVAQQEGSDVRPMARFQPIPVAHYIRHCLPESVITPYLSFGPASTPLEQNVELKECESWYASLGVDEGVAGAFGGGESLENMMKRMKEELKGQSDLELVQDQLSHHPLHDDITLDDNSMKVERPPRMSDDDLLLVGGGGGGAGGAGGEVSSNPGVTPLGAGIGVGSPNQKRWKKKLAPVSLPAMLHLLVREVEKGLNDAIRTVGSQAVVGTELSLGDLAMDVEEEEGRQHVGYEDGVGLVRERVVGGDGEGKVVALYCAWVGPKDFRISRKTATSQTTSPLELARFDLALPGGTRIKLVDFNFLDDDELVLMVVTIPGGTTRPKYFIVGIALAQIVFQSDEGALPHLPISRSHSISGDFPPERIALNGRQGRRLISVLSAEGRRLETLDIDPEFVEEEEEAEGDTHMQEG